MRIVVVGATGNVGTSLLRSLAAEDRVESIVGVARRVPDAAYRKTSWSRADVTSSDLVAVFRGADAVVHLAWAIQPSHDLHTLKRINVDGSRRVFRAVADAGVPALVYASSVGAYSPGPKEVAVDESWPTDGITTSFYSNHKAAVERLLDSFEAENPRTRVVRLRPALIFKREVGAEVRRLFAGPFLPTVLLRRYLIPVVPNVARLRFQCVHSYDVGDAYRLAAVSDVRGAFNIAADPVLDPGELGEVLGAKPVRVSPAAVRTVASATWKLHLQPTPPGWVDMALQTPILDSGRARKELDWSPAYTSKEALLDLLDGMRAGAGADTPPLKPRAGGPARLKEIATGIGKRQGV